MFTGLLLHTSYSLCCMTVVPHSVNVLSIMLGALKEHRISLMYKYNNVSTAK